MTEPQAQLLVCSLTETLKDLRNGALMMQEPALSNPSLRRYAAEVQRVVDSALNELQVAS